MDPTLWITESRETGKLVSDILLFLIGLFFIACIHSFDLFSRYYPYLIVTLDLFWSQNSHLKVHWLADSVAVVRSIKVLKSIVRRKYLLLKVFEKELQELRPVWAPTCN